MDSLNVTIFGIKLTLRPIAFSIPLGSRHWDIYWYGIIIATGFLLALIYAIKNSKRFGIDNDRMLDVVLVTVPLAILCARTYYVLFDGEKLEGIGDFFGFGDSSGFSGLAIYGGVIGAFSVGALMCKLRKVNILDMFDLTALGFLIGQGIGRWGNFVNQEAFGCPTGSSWWGMTSERVVSDFALKGFDTTALAHPCFLYESVWCILGFFLLHKLSKKRLYKGQIILSYCAWYGFGRGIIELLRTDSLPLGTNIRISSILSFVLLIASVTAMTVISKKIKEKNTVYENVFISEETDKEEIENGENN